MNKPFDVVIVGAGPAGIFAAYTLMQNPHLKILLLDKGPLLSQRQCPSRSGRKCARCNPCRILCGWGGAGAFSDGKLMLSPTVGGRLSEYLGEAELQNTIEEVDRIYLQFGAPAEVVGPDAATAEAIKRQAVLAELRYIQAPIRHLGSDCSVNVLQAMFEAVQERVEIRAFEEVIDLNVQNGQVVGVQTAKQDIPARYVIVAPGREGCAWLSQIAEGHGLPTVINPVDIGVRVEVPAPVMAPLTDLLYEPKLVYHSRSFHDHVRTFCVNPGGYVTTECTDGLITVNGHSFSQRHSDNTNFALLVSKTFTEPFKDPVAYGRHIAQLANLLGDGALVQRLGDLELGRRSTPDRIRRGIVAPTLSSATPGDLSLVLPYRHLCSLLEMLKALDQLAPGVYNRDTLLYGVEVKFYSSRLSLSPVLETNIHHLFTAGDGAGVTRGLVQASVSGLVIAREILRRETV